MNYIKLVNQYWEMERDRADFNAQVQLLYFALLYFGNKNGWKPFGLYREDIIERAKIGKNSYYPARQSLKDAGLISYKEGHSKTSKCEFTFIEVSLKSDGKSDSTEDISLKSDNTGDSTSDTKGVNMSLKSDKPSDHTIKPINITKPINNSNNNGSVDPTPTKEKSFEDKYKAFIDLFNKITKRTGARMFKGDTSSRNNFKARLNEGKTYQDFVTAITNGFADSHNWPSPDHFAPELLTRPAKFSKYLTMNAAGNNATPKESMKVRIAKQEAKV